MAKLESLFFIVALAFILTATVSFAAKAQQRPAGTRSDTTDNRLPTIQITLGGRTVTATVANTDESRRQGLLGWDSISEDRGMLLDFGREGQYAIHMQGMKFAIDAVWIDSDLEIKAIYRDIQPNSGLIYPSMFPSAYCLEIKAGFCSKYGIKMGQRVAFGPRR